MEKLSQKDMALLITAARLAVETAVKSNGDLTIENIPESLTEKRGVFVTLYVGEELRGCIGYAQPYFSIIDATVKAAQSAAVDDNRFASITPKELDNMRVEMSVLTKPEKIAGDPVKSVKVGKHGLIAEMNGFSGLLLPQVPVEEGWDVMEFLRKTCWKAGITPDMCATGKVKFSRFEAQVFTEKKGKAVVKKL